jgi:hypothetical protein
MSTPKNTKIAMGEVDGDVRSFTEMFDVKELKFCGEAGCRGVIFRITITKKIYKAYEADAEDDSAVDVKDAEDDSAVDVVEVKEVDACCWCGEDTIRDVCLNDEHFDSIINDMHQFTISCDSCGICGSPTIDQWGFCSRSCSDTAAKCDAAEAAYYYSLPENQVSDDEEAEAYYDDDYDSDDYNYDTDDYNGRGSGRWED